VINSADWLIDMGPEGPHRGWDWWSPSALAEEGCPFVEKSIHRPVSSEKKAADCLVEATGAHTELGWPIGNPDVCPTPPPVGPGLNPSATRKFESDWTAANSFRGRDEYRVHPQCLLGFFVERTWGFGWRLNEMARPALAARLSVKCERNLRPILMMKRPRRLCLRR